MPRSQTIFEKIKLATYENGFAFTQLDFSQTSIPFFISLCNSQAFSSLYWLLTFSNSACLTSRSNTYSLKSISFKLQTLANRPNFISCLKSLFGSANFRLSKPNIFTADISNSVRFTLTSNCSIILPCDIFNKFILFFCFSKRSRSVHKGFPSGSI